jgi:hypothetical protein
MSVRISFVFLLSRIDRDLAIGLIPHPRSPTKQLSIKIHNTKLTVVETGQRVEEEEEESS